MPSQRLFVWLLGFVVGLSPFAIDMYLPSMPSITQDLHTSPAHVQMTLSVYLAFFSIPQLFFGPLSDAIGRRKTIFAGLGLYLLGAILCGLAPNITTLLVARAVQATGSAAMVVTVPALVKDRFNNADYTATMGFIMMVMALAPLVAPIAGGFLLQWSGWRGIFFTLFILGVLCLLAFYRFIPETLAPAARVKIRPKALWQNYRTLLFDRHCLALSLCASFIFAGLMTFITGSSFVYINYYGVSEQWFGFVFGVNVLAMMALTFVNNRLVYRYDNAVLLKASVVAVSLASAGLLILATLPKPPLIWVMVCCALFIGNLGMLTANVMSLLMRRFAYIAGATAAFTGAMRFAIASLGGVFISLWHTGGSQPMLVVMALFGGLCLVSFLLAGKAPVPVAKGDSGPSHAG